MNTSCAQGERRKKATNDPSQQDGGAMEVVPLQAIAIGLEEIDQLSDNGIQHGSNPWTIARAVAVRASIDGKQYILKVLRK